MSSFHKYTLPVDQTEWHVPGTFDTTFVWEYDGDREDLLALYDKGKKKQWDAAERIDWSLDLDPENPEGMPDEDIAIYGTDLWNKMTKKERANLRRHFQAWQLSQFLHGEQGALICTAKIVQQVPNTEAKFYAATQVMDEARHVESYSRLLHEKFEMAYPITPPLKALLDNIVTDSRWDMTYLGMQILIEGLALAAFGDIRDKAQNKLCASINAYVMQDEARHVAFGRLALREYYPQLTQAERDEREEFVVEACFLMRDRFLAEEMWDRVGFSSADLLPLLDQAESMLAFRNRLFTRIVPAIKQIGLWGPIVKKGYEQMGIMEFANVDADALSAEDEAVAERFDADMLRN